MAASRIVPVIMCGGAGTRLWPVSRESMPKQFVPLVGPDSTFQQVLARIADPDLFDKPIVITNTDFRFVVAEQLRERGIEADIVLEPVRRDSGPAVAVAALLGAMRDPDAIVLVLAADHVIRKPDEFRAACRQAALAAAQGQIVTFGITPTHPATSYGYIRPGAALDGTAVRAVEAFVEKPDAATAAGYMADGYLWNSGNFLFQAATMLGEIERFEPEMAAAAKEAVAGIRHDLDFLRLAAEPFARAPKKSIDYAVMERTRRAAVVPADLGWSDVGSWSAVWEVLDRDRDGNAIEGPVVVMDSRNSLVRSDGSVLTTVVGLDNVVVVATEDAVLVASREKSEGVKALVEQLKAQNRAGRDRAPPHLPAVGLLSGHRPRRALPRQAHRREARQQAVAAEALPPLGALGGGQGHRRGHARRRRPQRARERVDLYPAGRRPPPGQSRPHPARTDRGAGRQLSGRGRHRAARRRVRAAVSGRV